MERKRLFPESAREATPEDYAAKFTDSDGIRVGSTMDAKQRRRFTLRSKK